LTAFCNQVGTGLALSRPEAERLRGAGAIALRNSSEFKRLVRDPLSEEGGSSPKQSSSKGLEGEVPLAGKN
jgi:hypothetical protein